ncbi:MAG TPA: hypothetical protein VGF45_10420, partial [Polyangia bacterium]
LPSTFGRHGTGEILDSRLEDDLEPPRSRRGLVVAAGLVAAVAGVVGLLFFRGSSGESTPEPTAAVAGPATGTTPPPPSTVRIAFSSDPAGADVVVKETGQHLGATPFESDIGYSDKPVTFVFAKLNFQSKERSLVPNRSSNLDTSLAPVPGGAGTESTMTGSGGTRGNAAKAPKPNRPRRPSPRPLPDDNGVLPPQL